MNFYLDVYLFSIDVSKSSTSSTQSENNNEIDCTLDNKISSLIT